MSGGVYQITNRVNGKRYIGGTVSFATRRSAHLARLRHGNHPNPHLQAAFHKYGEGAFAFSILEEVTVKVLIEREQHYLDTLSPEYNILRIAGSPMGQRHSLETRRKMSEAHKGEQNAFYGKHHNRESRRKMSEAAKGRRHTEATRQQMSVTRKGRRHSAETKHKISKARSAYWHRVHARE